jgi:diguanylate cyclase (GGDEF)-like protein
MTLSNLACTSLCTVIDRLEIGLIVLDKAHCILHWNRWLATRSGFSAEQAQGQALESIFPEISNSRLKLAVEHAIKDGLPSLLSPALHGTLLPLYLSAEDRRQEKRMQQLIHVLPLRDQASNLSCLIQISDMTANISRERLLRQQAENLRRSSTEDQLTQIANRRKFDETLANEFHKAQTRKKPLAIAIADIDLFHQYNDFYGRQAGDAALVEIANIFRSSVRPLADLVARYGGEEFAFILPGMSEVEACHFAESLRLRVVAQGLANESSSIAKHLTVSVGVTVMYPDNDADTHTLISSADVALYQAKHEGRNQAVCFSIEDGSFKACT